VSLGRQRVSDNVVGGILTVLLAAIAIAYSHGARPHEQATGENQEWGRSMLHEVV
jgi:hypothetical protein